MLITRTGLFWQAASLWGNKWVAYECKCRVLGLTHRDAGEDCTREALIAYRSCLVWHDADASTCAENMAATANI